MIISCRKNISRLLIIAFLFFLIPSDSFSLKGDERTGLKLIKQAEKLFKNYKYQESIDKFREAEKHVKLEKNLSRLYLGISRSYYAMGLMSQVRETINKLAMLSVKSSFKKSKYPRGYLKIYNDIQVEIEKKRQEEQIAKAEEEKNRKDEIIVKTEEDAESLYQVEKTGEETTELTKKDETPIVKKKEISPEPKVDVKTKKTFAGVIEKPGKKKKKKKSLILPIVLGAVALGAAAMLLGKKSDGSSTESTVSVHIESTPSGASVYVDGASKGVTTPCDITVSEGSREIRVQIERWGEASHTQNFAKDGSYSLKVKLAGYIYTSEFSYEINPLVPSGKWDLDHGSNLYSIYLLDGNYHLAKYDPNGVELFDRVLQYDKETSNSFYVFFNNISNVLYLHNYSIDTIHTYDPEGEYSGSNYNNIDMAEDLTENSSGSFYINQNGRRIQEYNNYQLVRDFLTSSSYSSFEGLKFSYDFQHIYIVRGAYNIAEKWIRKYDLSGNIVQSWSRDDWVSVTNITSHGSGDRERLFVQAYSDTKRIEIYDGNGELLSKSYGQGQTMVKIAEDGFGNIFAGSSTDSTLIKKWEPSSETAGNGIWETVSVISNRSGIRSGDQNRITPLRNQRSGKSDIKKDKKQKRIIK